MRRVSIIVACLLGLVVLVFGVEMIAAESGEVVVLRTGPDTASPRETRLWVVDEGGVAWLRAGHPRSGWLLELRERPEVELVRGGETLRLRAHPVPDARDRINALMLEKYGWADRYIGFLFSRVDAVPIRLGPATGSG